MNLYCQRIALGTAQFGSSYGISNQGSQVSLDAAKIILDRSWDSGIDTIDTAIAYGNSEKLLGEIGVHKWQIISKLPAIPPACSDVSGWVRSEIFASLERLKTDRLHGLLLHDSQELLCPHGHALFRVLSDLKDSGVLGKLGVSIYDPAELDSLWTHFQFDLIQAPANIIDRRLFHSGWVSRLQECGTEVHIRSIFLQGLLLMGIEERPIIFGRWQRIWDQWHGWLEKTKLNPLKACLGYALALEHVGKVVVGVQSLSELEEIIDSVHQPIVNPPIDLFCDDPDLVNPFRWGNI